MEVEELLKILACPTCHGSLEYLSNDRSGFLCPACAVVYPIMEDIPIMLVEEAIPLERWNQEEE